MNYELERKLNNKADAWELHNLQSENRQLKSDILDIERKIGSLEAINSNRYYALEKLFNLLAEHPQLSEISNQIYELRSNL